MTAAAKTFARFKPRFADYGKVATDADANALMHDLQRGGTHRAFKVGYADGGQTLEIYVQIGSGFGHYQSMPCAVYMGRGRWKLLKVGGSVPQRVSDALAYASVPVMGRRIKVAGGETYNDAHYVHIADVEGSIVTSEGVKLADVIRVRRDSLKRALAVHARAVAVHSETEAACAAVADFDAIGWQDHFAEREVQRRTVIEAMGGQSEIASARYERRSVDSSYFDRLREATSAEMNRTPREGYRWAWRLTLACGRPAHHGPQNEPMVEGEIYSAPDWDSTPECGGGIHSSETTRIARGHTGATYEWLIEIPLDARTVTVRSKFKSEHVIPYMEVGCPPSTSAYSPAYRLTLCGPISRKISAATNGTWQLSCARGDLKRSTASLKKSESQLRRALALKSVLA